MQTFILAFHVLVSIALIALILLQQGKGADAGAAFGSGASGSVFGASGSASFLSRTTSILATLFFVLSLALAIMAHNQSGQQSLAEQFAQPEVVESAIGKSDVPAPQVAETLTEPKSDVPSVPVAPAEQTEPSQ